MNGQIEISDIEKFKNKYKANNMNKILEDSIRTNGIESICLDKEILEENENIFNIELPKSKRYNQYESSICWIFAGFNIIKYNIAKNLNIDLEQLNLSSSYISFFDKLEKSNNAYENIINLDKEEANLGYINDENIFKHLIYEQGYWNLFINIVNKYGIIPEEYMKTSEESKKFKKLENIYFDKVKKDILYLLELKNQNASLKELRDTKETFLEENYSILAKMIGEPVNSFDFNYIDKENKAKEYKNVSPLKFKEMFLTLKLEDFVVLGNMPMYNRKFYKTYSVKYVGNIYKKSELKFLNLPIERIEDLCLKQLKEGIPIWFTTNISKYVYEEGSVLDTRIYDYQKVFGISEMSKEEALNTHSISSEHAMSICGAYEMNNKVIRWKVEDSYGNDDKNDGYYIMNNNFFEKYLMTIVVSKKYLSSKEIKLLDEKKILIGLNENF